jgi:Pyridoxamine 5'-phosphate oxidase
MDAKDEPVTEARHLEALTREECLRLLGGVPFGRVVFTEHALPAIRPVNHVVDAGHIVIRTSLGTAVSTRVSGGAGAVLAYEADMIEPGEGLGWSIVVVGRALRVEDAAERARYSRVLRPLVTGPMDDVIAISADLVTGFRLAPGIGPGADAGSAPQRAAVPLA